ncbi:MAG: hypothetical protein NZO16_05840, partial [Deltaproteobacteria bacterium]|nr:hypothetical protein [Deltaproteobacteria bacterium]
MKWFWLICFVATNVLGGVVGKLAAQSGLTPAQIFLSFNKYLIYMVLLFIFNWIFFINALKHFQLNVVNPVGTVFTIVG